MIVQRKEGRFDRLVEHWEQYYGETGMVQTPVVGVAKV